MYALQGIVSQIDRAAGGIKGDLISGFEFQLADSEGRAFFVDYELSAVDHSDQAQPGRGHGCMRSDSASGGEKPLALKEKLHVIRHSIGSHQDQGTALLFEALDVFLTDHYDAVHGAFADAYAIADALHLAVFAAQDFIFRTFVDHLVSRLEDKELLFGFAFKSKLYLLMRIIAILDQELGIAQ